MCFVVASFRFRFIFAFKIEMTFAAVSKLSISSYNINGNYDKLLELNKMWLILCLTS